MNRSVASSRPIPRSRRRALVAVVAAMALAVGVGPWTTTLAFADTAPASVTPATPETVSTDALPAPQIGDGLSDGEGDTKGAGVVWDQVVVGKTVYVGGNFRFARPSGAGPGEKVVARSNFLAYDLETGALLDYAPSFNQQVRSLTLSPDGKRLYVSGEYSSVSDSGSTKVLPRYRIAAIDMATGQFVSNFRPTLNATVTDVAVTNDTVYLAGVFSAVNGVARTRFAAVAASDGSTLPWAPVPQIGSKVASVTGRSLIVSPDGTKVVIAGRFASLNGNEMQSRGIAAVDAKRGALVPWKMNSLIRNGSDNTMIFDLASDGKSVYGVGIQMVPADHEFEGTFKASWSDGTLEWMTDCHGDTYSAAVLGDAVYTVSHAHYCGGVGGFPESPSLRALAFSTSTTGTLKPWTANTTYWNYAGQPAPSLLDWYPDLAIGQFTGANQAAWDVTTAPGYVLLAGEFSKVNGVKQRGLVRFATKDIAPNKDKPMLEAGDMAPTISTWGTSATKLTWTANWDRDNASLTYQLIRDGKTDKPVYTTTTESRFWARLSMSYVDRDCLVPGSSHTYQLRVTDPFGNARWGTKTTYTVPQPTTPSSTTAHRVNPNSSIGDVGTVPAGSTAVGADGDYLTRTGDLYVLHTGTQVAAKNVTSAVGAFLNPAPFIAYVTSDRQNGAFAHRMNPDGSIAHYPSVPAGSRAVGANADFLSPNGDLYDLAIKATPVASNVASAEGLWTSGSGNSITYVTSDLQAGSYAHRINPDGSFTRFPAVPAGARPVDAQGGTLAPNGDLYDENKRIASKVTSAVGIVLNPNGRFISYTTADQQDGSYAHRYANGSFGRFPAIPAGSTAVGATGDFLTKDGDLYFYMATTPVATNVTSAVGQYHTPNGPYLAYTDAPCFGPEAPASNKAPTAVFASTTAALTVSFDGAGSSDPDGTISAYAWDVGDGSTAEGKTTTATYAKAGTYTVKLTVTDDDGATATTSKTVSVTAPTAAMSATDDFERTVSGSWGAAQTGGTWSLVGSKQFGVSGGSGRIATAPGSTQTATLPDVSTAGATTSAVFTLDKVPAGGGQHLSVIGRQVGAERYSARLVVGSDGKLVLSVLRSGTVLTSAALVGTYVAGQPISIRISVTGAGTTTVAASAWMGSAAAPASWQVSANDTTAALQKAGTVGISTYTSSSGIAGTVRVDTFRSSAG